MVAAGWTAEQYEQEDGGLALELTYDPELVAARVAALTAKVDELWRLQQQREKLADELRAVDDRLRAVFTQIS